ncbi:SusC/RagA family TonB-linked outer membrane protein [Flavobacterium sp. CAU 1735]|uniref:SusC/RagA family TonB-linked outer membrane protein n=1 Tax=Flavobacterium sp. CAU 1735 TaxID=3140361 RepID=UPI0032608919
MRIKFMFLLTAILATQYFFAQERNVKGRITDSDNLPIPGVSVIEKGTTNGIQTDMNGEYTIKVSPTAILTISFLGMKTKEVKADITPLNIVLKAEVTEMDTIVVTALGIKREKKAVGYSVQEIKGNVINHAGQTNALSALSGNIAGIQVTAPSTMGGSSRILIRGIGSVTQNNRPLIVIDGIPMDNSNYNSGNAQRGGGGRDYGDAAADINPDDIESVSVLKGGPAAALYGSRAANGVIMYTTKSGKNGKTELSIKTGLTLENIYIMPRLQSLYGGGSSSILPTATINGQLYNLADYSTDESWGPKYNANLHYLPWSAFDPEYPNDYLVTKPWVSPRKDVPSFFNTGYTTTNNVAVSHATKSGTIRISLSNQYTTGVVPNSKLVKNTFAINGSTMLHENLRVDGTLSYTNTNAFNRPTQGYDGNSVAQKFFQWGQRQLDFDNLKNYKLPNGKQRSWNRTSWSDPTPLYSDNPYWTTYENTSEDLRNRYTGSIKLKYNFNKNLYAVGNIYGDQYNFTVQNKTAVYSQALSGYSQAIRQTSEMNYEARVHFDKRWDKFSLNSFIGINRRHHQNNALSGSTTGGLIIPNLYNLSNSKNLATATNASAQMRVNSVYAMVSLGYANMLYLEVTNRKDWFSTVTRPANYPSVTSSFIFSELLRNVSWLSYGKIRGGWAQVSNGASPYSLANYYEISRPFQSIPFYYNNETANNPDLIPETKIDKEIGLEVQLFKNRLGFDLALYENVTQDLIIPLQVTAATGFYSQYVNAGKMRNRGIELSLSITPIKYSNFSWNIKGNFSKNDNKLLSLYKDTKSRQLATSITPRVTLLAVVGEKYGQIYGYDYAYNEKGQRIINANGTYKTGERKALGCIIPDYNIGIRNTFNHKQWNLSCLIDIQKGGSYFSTTHMYGHYAGVLEETAANGIRENGIVLDGVLEDGSPNTKVIPAYRWARAHSNSVDAQNVFDASYIKLREITLDYNLPKKAIGKKISQVTFSAFTRNIFAWGLGWKGMDPENTSYGSGNIQGLEGGSLPSTRTYGMTVTIKI